MVWIHQIENRNQCDLFWRIFIHSFIHQCLYSPLLGPGLFFSSEIFFTQTVGLLGRLIILSEGRYLHTRQHKHRINAHTDIYALSGIRTQDPSVRAGEDSSCLRLRCHYDRLVMNFTLHKTRGIVWLVESLSTSEQGLSSAEFLSY
jgi:hypothetical protein